MKVSLESSLLAIYGSDIRVLAWELVWQTLNLLILVTPGPIIGPVLVEFSINSFPCMSIYCSSQCFFPMIPPYLTLMTACLTLPLYYLQSFFLPMIPPFSTLMIVYLTCLPYSNQSFFQLIPPFLTLMTVCLTCPLYYPKSFFMLLGGQEGKGSIRLDCMTELSGLRFI